MHRFTVRTVTSFAVALSVLAVLSPPPSEALPVPPGGPIAVAISPINAITYVGFANGTTITRLDSTGNALSTMESPLFGLIDALATDAQGNVWVTNGSDVAKLAPDGSELLRFSILGAGSHCTTPLSYETHPGTYGDLVVTGDAVYVALRCSASIEKYTLSGERISEQTAFTNTKASGIAWGPAQNDQPAKIYATFPEQGLVIEYDEQLQELRRESVYRPDGAPTPVPSDVVADPHGQIVVTDSASHALTFYDTNDDYSVYRILGHPPFPGNDPGELDHPSALAQYPVDGEVQHLQGNLYIAEAGNSRVQRWRTDGFTFWVATTGQNDASAPTNITPPSITGTPAVGQTLTCSAGSWTGDPTEYSYVWVNDDGLIDGTQETTSETTTTYVVRPGDAGQPIRCLVTALHDGTGLPATASAPVTIADNPSAPTNTAPPNITGVATRGSTLTCSPGSWAGSAIEFAYGWNRNGSPIPGAVTDSHVITAADLDQALTCTVTASNTDGTTVVTSAPVTPTAASPCEGGGIGGVTINDGARYTTSAGVAVTVTSPAGATAVRISNDGGFEGSPWRLLDADCRYEWTLRTTGDDRTTKHVYVRFQGSTVDPTVTLSDSIVLDEAAPSARAIAKQKGKKLYAVTVRAKDSVSGVRSVHFAKSWRAARSGNYKATAKRSFKVRSIAKYKYVRSVDRAGNHGTWKKVRIKRLKRR